MHILIFYTFHHFNSQPHKEADRIRKIPEFHLFHFNSQPHEEADSWGWWKTQAGNHFNSQPHEEADQWSMGMHIYLLHFNSQPHEEADNLIHSGCWQSIISTHSLTKRLTVIHGMPMTIPEFQLTASRRGWLLLFCFILLVNHFNSQPHEEADQLGQYPSASLIISTHSLTKRLTRLSFAVFMFTSFQLTASRRGWLFRPEYLFLFLKISTHSLTKRLTTWISWFQHISDISTHSLTKRLTAISHKNF